VCAAVVAALPGFLRAADKAKLNLPVIGSGGAAQADQANGLLHDSLGLLERMSVVVEAPSSKEFQARLQAAVGNRTGKEQPTAGHAYDAITLLLRAYAAAAEPKRGAEIAAEIPGQKFEGVWAGGTCSAG
jgi:ABC-type branched-subunit amino acid transport system substrate-binding protein